ncbi:hypothetical protein ACS0TY_022598 [Phlomoides rotata]
MEAAEQAEKSLADYRVSGNLLLREEVTDVDMAEIVSRWTGIPLSNLQQTKREKLVLLEDVLHRRVVGQYMAVQSVADANTLFQSGPVRLKPAYCKLYVHGALSRLVGTPPGYVRYEDGGQLTEVVRQRPYSVVLFEEIEKAHHDVFNILLQLFDDGRITDSQGRTVSFNNTVLVMTSNIGSHYILETLRNAQDSKDVVYDVMKREDATWEVVDAFKARFPELNLEDKVPQEGGGIDETLTHGQHNDFGKVYHRRKVRKQKEIINPSAEESP